jgi:hypothetical protein
VSEERKKRLKNVLYAIQSLDEFSSNGAKLQCSDVQPGYVTRVINQLTKDGHLDRVQLDE